MAMKRKSKIGEKNGMLTLLEWQLGNRRGLFICDCGNKTEEDVAAWRLGKTTSCGCMRKGKNSSVYRHGMSHSKLDSIHKAMKKRCNNLNSKDYKMYGGRGITVCDEWNDSVKFFEWALNNGYEEGLCIDRIDNSKGYSPNNCRWTTNKKNCNNTRKNRILEFNGEKHTVSEWSDILGIKRSTINYRINNLGWTVERALTESAYKGKNQSSKL